MKHVTFDMREHKCCVCGRKFLPAPQHVFHKNGKWCCKWTCYAQLLKQLEAKRPRRGRVREVAGG